MDISNIILIGIVVVAGIVKIVKIVNTAKSQTISDENITDNTSSNNLNTQAASELPEVAVPKRDTTIRRANPNRKTTSKTVANSPKSTQNSTEEEEFDLKKAVVYSEILTPKFKKEDF